MSASNTALILSSISWGILRPMRAALLVRMIKRETPPSNPPTRSDPIASKAGLPRYDVKPIQPAAHNTPKT